MKKKDFINELNNALREGIGSNRNNDYIQTDLTCEQWQELAPQMDARFAKPFEDMTDEQWENNEEVQFIVGHMVGCSARCISAVLIDPYDNNRANVIFGQGVIETEGGEDFVNRYVVVNV